jgi:ribosomal protein S27AE
MAASSIATKQVVEMRQLIEGVAKNFVDRVYGPQGPEWGTRFVDIEELAVQIGQAVSRKMCDQALQRQAAAAVPSEDQVCPACGRPVESADPEPRIVTTRAGDTQWLEPHRHCPRCRRSFFPSVEASGD